ncbi:60S ribosomal protein L18-like [Ursus arctos]|uniref:60S ribosomal protein L18-like n=1 Tax=Ursus arctos TaxID=9644 RepID=UPI002017B8D8|nr:60S ribosomal protein L18-like [Ursus arctos]
MKLPVRDDETAVVVGTVTDDVVCPQGAKLYLCALRVYGHAQRRILRGGGEILALDQLALDSPKGCGTGRTCAPVLERAERCTGIWARSRETGIATPDPKGIPRAECARDRGALGGGGYKN